jgi:hypothetical protein
MPQIFNCYKSVITFLLWITDTRYNIIRTQQFWQLFLKFIMSPVCWVVELVPNRYSKEQSFARLVRTGVPGSNFFEVCLDSALMCSDTRGMKLWNPSRIRTKRVSGHSRMNTLVFYLKTYFEIVYMEKDRDLCEGYILRKQKMLSFTTIGRTPKPEKLEMVHIDLWGPSPVESLGGSRYYVTFINDSSKMVWVYFFKSNLRYLKLLRSGRPW